MKRWMMGLVALCLIAGCNATARAPSDIDILITHGTIITMNPERRVIGGRVRQSDLTKVDAEAHLDLLGEVHASGDGMIQTEFDQAFARRQRHQALRRLAGDVHFQGDFVLGILRNIVEPPRASGIVQAETVGFRITRHGQTRELLNHLFL